MFATLLAVRGNQRLLVGTIGCEPVGSSIVPIRAGTTFLSTLNSCNYTPTTMHVPQGFRLHASVGVTFGSAKPMPLSEGPTFDYPSAPSK